MSTGEEGFLALALTIFVSYIALLGYGVAVASERPDERARDERLHGSSGRTAKHAH